MLKIQIRISLPLGNLYLTDLIKNIFVWYTSLLKEASILVSPALVLGLLRMQKI